MGLGLSLGLGLGLTGCGNDGSGGDGNDDSAGLGPTGGNPSSDEGSGSGGSGTGPDGDETSEPPPPECAADEVACGSLCTDLQTDPGNCGQCGRSCVIPQATAACIAGECALATCDPGFSDCDGQIASGCETPLDCQEGSTCETSCGSMGTLDCTDACASAGDPICTAPAELCNVIDDDCDGVCDQGPLPGCRVGVHRSNSPTLGHYYTTDLAEAQSGDLNLEAQDYFYLYGPGVEGLQPFFRCIKPNGKRWMTTSTDCEGTAAPELTVGFISMDERCGATPLYRLLNAGPDAHFYTTSAAERDNAINNIGFVDEGIAGYIWSGP